MKILRFFILALSLSLLSGCFYAGVFPPPVENPDLTGSAKKNPVPSEGTPIDYDDSIIRYFAVKPVLGDENFVRIDDYRDYLDFISRHDIAEVYEKIDDYDEGFFASSGLILFYRWEPSGSIRHEIDGVYLDDADNLIIVVDVTAPYIHTDDEAEYLFAVEYEKPEREVADIYLKYVTSYYKREDFVLDGEACKKVVGEFLAGNRDDIVEVRLDARFLEHPEPGEPYKGFNERNAEKYGLSRVKGDLIASGYIPSVAVKFASPEDIDLDLLVDIAGTDDLISLKLEFLRVATDTETFHYPKPSARDDLGREIPVKYRGLYAGYHVNINKSARIDTYQDYLDFVSEYGQIIFYDEEFFAESGLVIYSHYEPSGSNRHTILGVYLDDDDNMTILVDRYIPRIGTCDVVWYKSVIEYEKPKTGIKDIVIKYINRRETVACFELTSKAEIEKARNFIAKEKEKIININLNVYHNGNLEKYRLERVRAKINISPYLPYAVLSFESADDIDFDLLWEIATTDHEIKLNLPVIYEVVEIAYVHVK